MSKSVLVINTPKDCGKCKFISAFWCRAMNDRKVPNNDMIPGWCPLISLPEKEDFDDPYDEYYTGYANGWNRCLEEIMGKNLHEY